VALSATIGGAAVGYLATQFAMPAATSMATLTGAIVGAVLGFGLYSVIQNSRGQPA
jgi:outer membrane lipoprotein SlyB